MFGSNITAPQPPTVKKQDTCNFFCNVSSGLGVMKETKCILKIRMAQEVRKSPLIYNFQNLKIVPPCMPQRQQYIKGQFEATPHLTHQSHSNSLKQPHSIFPSIIFYPQLACSPRGSHGICKHIFFFFKYPFTAHYSLSQMIMLTQ